LNLLNQHLDLAAPSGESFYQFYGRYSHRLKELLNLAESSPNSIAVVTHVRNLLATASVITGSDVAKVPVKGGPHTGALLVVEKAKGRWTIGPSTHELVVVRDANIDVRLQAVT
jgi:broad specificity phosphatase PhoE